MKLLEVIAAFAPSGTSVGLQESIVDGSDYYDPDIGLTSSQGGSLYYRRLTQSASDLTPLTQERMQQMALYLYDRNPLAKRCLELIKDFVVGEGFRISSKDKDLQAVIDRFWEDGQNDFDLRMHTMTLELGLWGEQLYAAFVHEGSGHTRIVSIDPRTIGEVIPDPSNSDHPLAVRLKGPTGTDSKYLKVIRENDEGLLVGAEPGETIRVPGSLAQAAGSVPYFDPMQDEKTTIDLGMKAGTRLVGCFFFPANKVQGATRGRSDLLPVADLLDLYDRLIFDEAERMSFMRSFIFDVTIKGGTPQQITERAAAEGPPRPGTVKFHNESEAWAAISPDLKAQDGATTADMILSLIATGVGLPKTWLNGIMDVNRASAGSMDEPSLKRLRARQLYIQEMIRNMVRFALDQAVLAGGLSAPGDKGHDFQVESPEMSRRDLVAGSSALGSTAQAFGLAQAAGWTDPGTAQQAITIMLSQIGVNLDADELKKRVDEFFNTQQKAKQAEDDGRGVPNYIMSPEDAVQSGSGGGTAGEGSPAPALPGASRTAPALGAASSSPAAPAAFVPLSPKDIPAAFSAMAGGLVNLGNAGVIDAQLAQEVVAQLLSGIGIQVDIEAMQSRIEADEAENEAEAAEIAAGDAELALAQGLPIPPAGGPPPNGRSGR